MKLIKVSALGTDNKVCYDAVNDMFHIPKNLRETIKVGDFATIINKHFDVSSVTNNETGETTLSGPAFDRLQVSSIGTKDEVLSNAGESGLLAKELDLWINKETATIAAKYSTAALKPA